MSWVPADALDTAAIRRVYTRLAPRYDLWAGWTERLARQRVLELARVLDGESVLEVAVGTGLLFAELLRANPHGRNEGLDLTEAMLARARERVAGSRATQVRLRVGDAKALDFAGATFDALVNTYLFDLLPEADFTRVLAEFRRVLRPGGRLVVASLAPSASPLYRMWMLLHRLNPALVGGCRGVVLAGPLAAAGFRVERHERVVQLTIATEVFLAVRSD